MSGVFADSLLAMAWIEDFESISSTSFVNFSEYSVSWFSAVYSRHNNNLLPI